MSRFNDLLNVLLPEMDVRIDYARIAYATYKEAFTTWSTRQASLALSNTPPYEALEPSAGREVWALYGFSLLWQDRYLAFPLRDLYTGWHFQNHWFAHTKEEFIERIQSPQEQALCLAECFRFLHAHSLPTSSVPRSTPMHEKPRHYVSEVKSFRHAKDFFGRAFLPLLKAYTQYDEQKPEVPSQAGGSLTLLVNDLNRSVVSSLGIVSYRAQVHRRRRVQAPERYEVSLATYTQQERDEVARRIVSGQATRLPVRLTLCELALRGVLSEGIYLLQPDDTQKAEE